MSGPLHVLAACEESGRVVAAFRKRGHLAWSVDLQETTGDHPEFHIVGDVFDHIDRAPDGARWDLMVACPPCTTLTVAGNKWCFHPEDRHLPQAERRPHPNFPDRARKRDESVEFIKRLWAAPIPRICIENPGRTRLTKLWRRPTQRIHPFYFGEPVKKLTGLWLKGLPELKSTGWVEPEMYRYKNGVKCDSLWYRKTLDLPRHERSRARSKTFVSIAAAMADQWGGGEHTE